MNWKCLYLGQLRSGRADIDKLFPLCDLTAFNASYIIWKDKIYLEYFVTEIGIGSSFSIMA